MNYAALKAEIINDPTGLGYAQAWNSGFDSGVADILNAVRSTIDVSRGVVQAYEVFECILPADWAALTADNKQRVQSILSMGAVDASGSNTRAAFLAAFAAGTTTRANLIALATRKGSRAEQLFGQAVTSDDIAIARRI